MALNIDDSENFYQNDTENPPTPTLDQNAQGEDYESVYEDDATIDDKSDNNRIKSILFDLVFYAVMIFVCIYIIPNFVMQRTIVDGSSMANTLYNGEHLMVEKITYRFNALDRFDIIVFYPYGREKEEYYVKRVIGLPGETIQILGSDILINGELLVENFGRDPITYAGIAYEPIVIGEDEYFVMGDHREISKDSRYPDVGTVSKENIGGKAFLRIWPLNRFGAIK